MDKSEVGERARINGALMKRAQWLLSYVQFQNYIFTVREAHGGVLLRADYPERDVYTGHTALQYTRDWRLTPSMTDSEIVQTAFKLCITSMEHRTREHFKYKGARVFGPHFDVEDLVRLCQDGRENAGGRKA